MSTYSCPDCGGRVPDNEVCACVLCRRPTATGIVLVAASIVTVGCLVALL